MKQIPMDDLELRIIQEEFTDLLILDLEGKTKEDILLNIAKFAKEKGLVKDEQVVYQKFLDREKLGTTAAGNGVALPEACWIEMARPYAYILCRTREEIDFNSPGKKGVRIVLVFLGGDKNDITRIKYTDHFTMALKSANFRSTFLRAKTAEEAYRVLCGEGMGFDKLRKKYISRDKNTKVTDIFDVALGDFCCGYNNHKFFTERDVVWTLQNQLVEVIKKYELHYTVFNDYPMIKGKRRSLCADLVIVKDEEYEKHKENACVEIAIELKYEPDRNRPDLLKSKFKPTVVFWEDGVLKDMERVKQFVDIGKAKEGISIFIDEGRYFRKNTKYKEPTPSNWSDRRDISLLIYQVSADKEKT